MGFAASGGIPAAFLCFALLFPHEQRNLSTATLIVVFLPAILFLLLSLTNQIVSSLGTGPQMFRYGPSYRFYSIYLVSYIFLGFYFLTKTYKRSIGIARLQIKYCFLGMILTASSAVTTNLFLPMAGISTLNWLGPFFTIFYVGFVTYSIVKYRLMDTNIVLRKGTTYVLLLVLLFVPSFFIILLNQSLFFGKINYFFSAVAFCLLFVVALIFQRLRPSAEKAVEHFLFKDKYNYRETLGKFSKAMVSILDLQSLCKRIIETITQTMGVEKASLFLLNEEKGEYELIESKNLETASIQKFSKESPLPYYLQKLGEIIVREEQVKGAEIPEIKKVIDQMSDLEAEVTIPLISKGRLVGMINLSHKFNKDIYAHEDIELLSTLANQTAIALENARLYEDLKKSKSYIRRADRLASLGTLTAGLAHEIRNPLVAIKTFTQLLPERLEDEEFRNHFLTIASSEVDRISSLINELLEFARPSDPKLELEDVNSILDGMILLISTETKKKHVDIIKYYSNNLPRAKVDREQIKQVFLNVLLNAIEATPENGRISVRTRSFIKPGGDPYIQIEFTDTGYGIPREHLEEIFNPFFTTKDKGCGLGLSISSQIVQDHKGYITVESELNQGSSFFINIPVNQEHPKRRRNDFDGEPNPLRNPLERT
jgi:signal transduction histidine kinase